MSSNVESGPPRQLYEQLRYQFTAQFLGVTNFITGRRVGRNGGATLVETPLGRLSVAGDVETETPLLSIRPEHIGVHTQPAGTPNEIEATPVIASFLGAHHEYVAETRGSRLTVRTGTDCGVRAGPAARPTVDLTDLESKTTIFVARKIRTKEGRIHGRQDSPRSLVYRYLSPEPSVSAPGT